MSFTDGQFGSTMSWISDARLQIAMSASISVPENNNIIYVRFQEYWTRSRGESNTRDQDQISWIP